LFSVSYRQTIKTASDTADTLRCECHDSNYTDQQNVTLRVKFPSVL